MIWLLVLAAVGMLADFSWAEPRTWDLNGVGVRRSYDMRWYGKSASSADGSMMTVWTDARNGRIELFGQLLSPAGEPQWGDDGRLLARSEGIGVYWPVITYSADGFVVQWQDVDTYTSGEGITIRGRVRAMKFAADGERLWNDTEQFGVLIYDEQSNSLQEGTSWVVPDGTGGAYVCWINETYFFAQRVTSAGTLAWAAPLEVNHNNSGWGYDVGTNGAGNLVYAWKSGGAISDIHCVMIEQDGNAPWITPVRVCHVANYITNVKLIADGNFGVIVAWLDERQSEQPLHIYAQRVSGSGVTLWQENGRPIVASAENKFGLELVSSFNEGQIDGVLATWHSMGASTVGYGQKFDLSGSVQWQAGGVALCEPIGEQAEISVVSDLHGGALRGWVEFVSNFSPNEFRLSRLNAAGQLVWESCETVAAEGVDPQEPQLSVTSEGNVVSSWQEYRNLNGFTYSQLHDMTTGEELLPQPLSLDGMIDGYARNQRILALPDGKVVTAWRDSRLGSNGFTMYFQVLDPTGVAQFARDGIQLIEPNDPSEPSSANLGLCEDGAGGFFAAVADLNNQNRVVRATRWNADGEQVGPSNGVTLNSPSLQSAYEVIPVTDGAGGAFVAFTAYDEQFMIIGAYLTRIDENCQPVWDEPVQVSTTTHIDEFLFGVVPSLDGSCIVVWRAFVATDYFIRAARVLADGTIAWSTAATGEENSLERAHVAADLNGGVVVTWEHDRTVEGDVYIQRIDSDGEAMWPNSGLPVAETESREFAPKIDVDNLGNVIVAWQLALEQEQVELLAQKVSPAGEFLWPAAGKMLEHAVIDVAIEVTALNYENLYFVWSARHPVSLRSMLYATHLNALGQTAEDPFWIVEHGSLVSEEAEPVNLELTATDDEAVVVVWEDYRIHNNTYSLYAQRFYDPIPATADERPSLPTEFSLAQNYPNPFNPETVIEFVLPSAGKATLKVFDVTGRLVATLVDEPLAAGVHRTKFDAARLASGLYFCSLQAGHHTMTRKMVALK